MKIEEVVAAFDAVIPGYAWAWHDAMAGWRRNHGRPERGWRDPRRRNLDSDDDRCLLVYGFRHVEDDDRSIVVWNRGYVELMQAVMSDREQAVEALQSMSDDRPTVGEGYFYNGGTDFGTRCAICLNVLAYLRDHARSISPLWKDAHDLPQTS